MKAKYVVIPEKSKLEIMEEDLVENKLQDSQLLIESEVSVVSSGTELATFTALSKGVYKKGSRNAYPCRPGYGLVGKILAKGRGVNKFEVGDRIFCFGPHASHLIYDLDLTGKKPFQSAFKVDDDISSRDAVIARMGLISLTAPQISQVPINTKVAVFGLGIVGNLISQLYQIKGANVLALDPIEKRCRIASESGIKKVGWMKPEEQIEAVKEFSSGIGVDIAIDAVGDSRVIGNCISSAKDHGEIILLGSPRTECIQNITDQFNRIHMHSLTLKGALEWRLPAYSGWGVNRSIESNLSLLWSLIKTNQINVDHIISHVVRPEELMSAYEGLLMKKQDYLGVLINWKA